MDLDSLTSGASGQMLDFFDEDTRRLVTVLCLPLIDGVFATLLVSGAVSTFSDIIAVSLTIFTGAGALAVLYSTSETVEEAKRTVAKAAPVLVAGALVTSLVAPVFEQIFYIEMMRTVAGLALLSIALNMLGMEKAKLFPVPAIILTGAVLSIKSPQALALTASYIVPALLTSLSAVAALYLAAYVDSSSLNLHYIRRGGAAVLTLIALSQFGLQIPSNLGLAVFGASVIVSYRASC
ncbi:DUF5794 domain-containing protein [Candidatus Nanosalina sp. VS9-1]|uniref:DUF5794 domain-containing protein n=1 Tax=Candidatus Nanosalina sp. VS9-1 TaxID=3388566 RepID=UPI0039E008C4